MVHAQLAGDLPQGRSQERASATASLRNCSGYFDLPDTGNILPQTAVWDQGVRFKGTTSMFPSPAVLSELQGHQKAAISGYVFSRRQGGSSSNAPVLLIMGLEAPMPTGLTYSQRLGSRASFSHSYLLQ